jgi:hypothetical protein
VQFAPLSACGEGRERVGKKQHTHQKAELFHTFRVFFALAPLCLLQNAGMLLAWHACLGPAPMPIMPPATAFTQRMAHEASKGPKVHPPKNLFAILFQPGDEQSAALSGQCCTASLAFGQGACATPKGGKQVFLS